MKALKIALIIASLLIGLASIAASLGVRQVPIGQKVVQPDGRTIESGLYLGPIWQTARLEPLIAPPQIEAPAPPASSDAQTVLTQRLDETRSRLNRAEEAAAQEARGSDSALAEVEAAHQARLARMRSEAERDIAALTGEAEALPRQRATEAEAERAELISDARVALARAEAVRDGLLAETLAAPGGRYYTAIEAARRFELGDVHLPSPGADFLRGFGVDQWRRFFLGEAPPRAPRPRP